MRVVFLVAALVAAASAYPRTPDMVWDQEIIDQINSNQSSWVAGKNEFFKGWTQLEARRLLGLRLDMEPTNKYPVKTHDDVSDADIPSSFDARKQWPKYIHPIRDQQRCGSCWAFSASEVLSDRFAITTEGKTDVVLSPEDLVSCDKTDMGCQGGMLENAWEYLDSTGIVTDGCFPYGAGSGTPPACATKCADSETWTKYKAKDVYQLKTVKDIQAEIMKSGPVQAGFKVYKSFMSYTSGVYDKPWYAFWDTLEGGHAVKIVGWGEDKGTKYWTIANSWNTNWGEDGYFRIKQGNCGINDMVYAGHADSA